MPFFAAADGTSLYYNDWGTGKPVVLVPAAFMGIEMWEYQLPFLAEQGLRCISYDRRGHGRSDRPWDGYDYDTLADDLAALIEHLDLREITLVGYSMGGGEVVRYLSRHGSDRVARIALVAATAPFPLKTADNPDGIDQSLADALVAQRTADRPKWFTDNAPPFFAVSQGGNAVSPELVQWMTQMCLQCSPRATRGYFDAIFGTDLRAEMRAIAVPTLIIHGDADRSALISICGRKSAQLVPGNRFIVYEGAPHGLCVTHADRLNADLLAFANAA